MRTYEIQLKADYVDPEKHDILLEALREAAAQIYTTALLLKDKRDPQIALQTGDLFVGTQEIALSLDGQDEKDAERANALGE